MAQERMENPTLTLPKTGNTSSSCSPKRAIPLSLLHGMHNLLTSKSGGRILLLEVQLSLKATHSISLNRSKALVGITHTLRGDKSKHLSRNGLEGTLKIIPWAGTPSTTPGCSRSALMQRSDQGRVQHLLWGHLGWPQRGQTEIHWSHSEKSGRDRDFRGSWERAEHRLCPPGSSARTV